MWFEEFQDGCHRSHVRYWNRTILAMLNFHNSPMPPIKLKLDPTSFGSRCDLKIFKMAVIVAISDENETILVVLNLHVAPMPSTKFRLNATYRSRADNNCRLTRWQTGYRNKLILVILNLHVISIPPTKFWLIPTDHSGADVV